ncbi:phage protein F-like protein [Fusobacterium gonidiaformans 3-1-5R]|uniref:Phage protein F-like protein n=2 Tax=Fusobacterium TaxID=848 RepID=E5BEP5_9FUSO|nr:phage protein F-like protein [Fusobacterium gonidiaformans 3-1-5R]
MFLLGYLDSQEKALEFEEELDPFSLSFTKAIKSIIDRNPAMYDTIEKIEEEARNRMFWIKKSTELEATKKVLTSLQKNLEKGGTYHEWKKDIESIAEKAGLGEDGWYSELVYRNAMNNAYAAGRYQEQMDNIKQRPYFMYSAINDDRTSEICRSLDGKVYPADDAIWHVIYPPNHHNCRSQVIALNEKEVQGYGLEIEKPDKEIKKMAKNMKNFNTAPVPQKLNFLQKIVKIKEKALETLKKKIERLMYLEKKKKEKKAIVELEKKIKKYILSNKCNKKFNKQMDKHFKDSKNYIIGRSYFTVPRKKIEELVSQRLGNGKVSLQKNGEWKKQEIIDLGEIVGVDVKGTEEYVTSIVKVHYGKTGIHAVPYAKRKKGD